MKTPLALAVALVTLVAFGGTALAARTSGSTEVVRWISQPTAFVVVLANGDRPDPTTLQGQPQPGDEFFQTQDFFATEDGRKKGDKIGNGAIHCLFGATHQHCEGTIFFEGGQLYGASTIPLHSEDEPDVAFTGGTGEFRDAGGDAHFTDISTEKQEMILWEVRLLHLSK